MLRNPIAQKGNRCRATKVEIKKRDNKVILVEKFDEHFYLSPHGLNKDSGYLIFENVRRLESKSLPAPTLFERFYVHTKRMHKIT